MKQIKSYIQEKLIIKKDSTIAEIKTEEDFVKKYNLECIKRDSSTHNYKLSKEFYDNIVNKFQRFNEFEDKLQDYIKNTLKLPEKYSYESYEHYDNKYRSLTLALEDVSEAESVCYIVFLKESFTLQYILFHIDKYPELEGVIFNILDFIIEI